MYMFSLYPSCHFTTQASSRPLLILSMYCICVAANPCLVIPYGCHKRNIMQILILNLTHVVLPVFPTSGAVV